MQFAVSCFTALLFIIFISVDISKQVSIGSTTKVDFLVNTTSNDSTKVTPSEIGGRGGRDPKILSFFQNLLKLPAQQYRPLNQYHTDSSAEYNNQYYNHHHQLLPQASQQHQQIYDRYEPNKQDVIASSTNVLNAPQQQQHAPGNSVAKFAFGDLTDLSSLTNLLSFGSVEGMLERVNKFDQLKCIPKMMCQMIAKRQEDAERDSTSTTTARTTKAKKTSRESLVEKRERDSDDARFIKIQGVDTALSQVVKFLDVMQLKDWSLYPYLQGAYEGHQVKKSDDCLTKYSSCPFSDEQLVYYFNNYNGGFFQSFRSGRKLNQTESDEKSETFVNEKKLSP